MALLFENYENYIQYNGLNTNKNITVGGSANFDASGSTGTFKTSTGVTTVGGNLVVTGTSTFTGAMTGKSNVISGQGATATLTAAQSGSVVLFDRAAGITYTLPAPSVGLEFDFFATTTVTSNSYKIITDAGTTLIAGAILGNVDNTANKSWVGNGTTHIAITQAAASTNATGGIIGSWVRVTCVTATLWVAAGMTIAGGTPTTPFATS